MCLCVSQIYHSELLGALLAAVSRVVPTVVLIRRELERPRSQNVHPLCRTLSAAAVDVAPRLCDVYYSLQREQAHCALYLFGQILPSQNARGSGTGSV